MKFQSISEDRLFSHFGEEPLEVWASALPPARQREGIGGELAAASNSPSLR